MNILTSLGVDWTLGVHLVSFLVSYLALTQLVFKPYMRAYEEREKRTFGNEREAERLIRESGELQAQYEQKAKVLNSQIKSVFDASRSEAQREYDQLVQVARDLASKELEANRSWIGQEIQKTRTALGAEVPALSAIIASKLAGKDLSR